MQELLPWKFGTQNALADSLRREFNQLFDRFWSGQLEPMQLGRWAPRVDVSETPETVHVRAEIAGVDPEKLELTVENNVLTIKGEKPEGEKLEGETFHRVERQYGTFARNVQLPAAVVSDAAEAKAHNGVIEITLPKQEEARPKHVRIDVGD